MSKEETRDLDERAESYVVERTSWLGNAPWWLISTGLHVVLMLAAALIYVERLIALDDGAVTVAFTDPRKVCDLLPEPPERGLHDRNGIPTPDPSDAEAPLVFIPDAVIAKDYSDPDGTDGKLVKGEGEKFLGWQPGKSEGFRGTNAVDGKAVYGTLGVGGGNGRTGKFGDRGKFGLIKSVPKAGGPRKATDSAVIAALRWLARHQNPDGSWGAGGFAGRCTVGKCTGHGDAAFDSGVTGLAVLAFLGAGFSHLSRDEHQDPVEPGRVLKFGECVKKGVQWLIAHQDPEGCLGERGPKYMYNHCVAALALTEAYGMTAAGLLKDPAQKAIDFVVASQNPGKGWRYSFKSGDNDTSVTGWAVMALKSAELSELAFPKSAFDGALAWLDEVTENSGYYPVGYNQKGTGKVYVPGKNEEFDGHPSMEAVAVMSRIFISKRKDPKLGSVLSMVQDLPQWRPNKIDFYYWYYASLALFQYDTPDGALWTKWNEPMVNALVPNQKTAKDGCQNGSWPAELDRWGFEGGRVYATAINALTLEVYYRYGSVFGGKKDR